MKKGGFRKVSIKKLLSALNIAFCHCSAIHNLILKSEKLIRYAEENKIAMGWGQSKCLIQLQV